jgi:hypothetical protein
MLEEFYCDESSGKVYVDTTTCANGCQNGACIKSSGGGGGGSSAPKRVERISLSTIQIISLVPV